MAERTRCVAATDEHADGLAAFFRETWDPTATAASVLAARQRAAERNLAEPGRPLPTWIALQGERVIGYCGSLAVRFWNGQREMGAYWAKGLMVLPEFRNGPIGFHVLKSLTGSVPCIAAVTVHPASKRLFTALGYRDHGALPNRIRPLSISGILRNAQPQTLAAAGIRAPVPKLLSFLQKSRLAGIAGLPIDAAAEILLGRGASGYEASLDAPIVAAEFDDLWNRVRSELSASTVRDARALAARYYEDADVPYRVVTVRRAGRLDGVALLRPPRADGDPRLAGVRVVSLSDLLVSPRDVKAHHALLSAAESGARSLDGDALLCSASHGSLAPSLRRRGYLSRPGNVHFFLRWPRELGDWPETLDNWWLARGDGESDTTF